MDIQVLTIVGVDGEPIHISGGETEEQVINLLQKAIWHIKFGKEEEVEQVEEVVVEPAKEEE